MFQNILSGITSVTNSLDQEQAPRFVGSDRGPNYLPKLSADDHSRQGVLLGCMNLAMLYRSVSSFSEMLAIFSVDEQQIKIT